MLATAGDVLSPSVSGESVLDAAITEYRTRLVSPASGEALDHLVFDAVITPKPHVRHLRCFQIRGRVGGSGPSPRPFRLRYWPGAA